MAAVGGVEEVMTVTRSNGTTESNGAFWCCAAPVRLRLILLVTAITPETWLHVSGVIAEKISL